MAANSLLEEALTAWRDAREGVVSEVQNIPADKFDFKPKPESRTLNELVLHIAQSGNMMSGELSRADGDFQRQDFASFYKEYHAPFEGITGKAELLDLLERDLKDGAERFRSAGELQLLQLIRQFNGVPATRMSWMYHGIAHEEYHRGQIALYARLLGIVPALTKLIYGT